MDMVIHLPIRSPIIGVHLCSYPNTSRNNGVESSHVLSFHNLEIASCVHLERVVEFVVHARSAIVWNQELTTARRLKCFLSF